jgi:P-type Ca2+ transporter type 2C
LLNVRSDTRSVFSAVTFENRWTFVATAAVVLLLVLVVEMDALHGVFTTIDLTSWQWLTAFAIGSTILWVSEVVKAVLRWRHQTGHTSV